MAEKTVQIEQLEDGTFLVGELPEGAEEQGGQPAPARAQAEALFAGGEGEGGKPPMGKGPMMEQGGEEEAEQSTMKPAPDLQTALKMAGDLFTGGGMTDRAGAEQAFAAQQNAG